MLRYEAYNFNSGKRTDEPTLDEITDKTNKFFMLRAFSSLTMPVAIGPEMDFYQQTYRQFLNQYGPGEAEAKFLEMYPDYFEATVSLSKSPGSLEANMDTVKNLKRFRGLMAEAEASNGVLRRVLHGVEVGHAMDLKQAKYVSTPNWQQAFAIVTENGKNVQVDLIYIEKDGTFQVHGRRYGRSR